MIRLEYRVAIAALIIAIVCVDLCYPWMNFNSYTSRKRTDLKKRCPNVRAQRNFDLEPMMGNWYVVQYYASTEELPEYACMRSHFTFTSDDQHITMNFSYIYAEDPLREKLVGNIT
ncbi:uncharacterized protein LOC133325136, partial [Musca vetustissima]|uniref:uncharacterized protein LOC133325136 n=1 Tax=Musca vetustissima TaxID=27455 RepID=UPI002AB6781F